MDICFVRLGVESHMEWRLITTLLTRDTCRHQAGILNEGVDRPDRRSGNNDHPSSTAACRGGVLRRREPERLQAAAHSELETAVVGESARDDELPALEHKDVLLLDSCPLTQRILHVMVS